MRPYLTDGVFQQKEDLKFVRKTNISRIKFETIMMHIDSYKQHTASNNSTFSLLEEKPSAQPLMHKPGSSYGQRS